MSSYTPDTHDTTADAGSRELLGQGRMIPASFSMKEHARATARSLACDDTVAAFVVAIETREAMCKRPVVLDEQGLQDLVRGGTFQAVSDALGVGQVAGYAGKRVLRVKASAHEMLLEVRQALMHGHPVVIGYWQGEEHAAGVLVGYDQHGQFELVTYPPGTPVRQVSGEWLIASAIDMVIVDGAPVASTVK